MGALTRNRKRGEDYHRSPVSISSSQDQSCNHLSKRLKFSFLDQNMMDICPPASYSSVISRISSYPDLPQGFPREVHGPVRKSRLGLFSLNWTSSFQSSTKKMRHMVGIHWAKTRLSAIKNSKSVSEHNYMVDGQTKERNEIGTNVEEVSNQQDLLDDSSIAIFNIEAQDVWKNKWQDENRAAETRPDYEVKLREKEPKSFDSSVLTDVNDGNAKLGVEEKMDLIQLDYESVALGVPVHKKLYASAKNREHKLFSLGQYIEFFTKCRQKLQLLWPQKNEEQIKKDVAEDCFTPLTNAEEGEVSRALSELNRRRVLATHENSNIHITGEILQCLSPGEWLNDEIINVYVELLKERERREPQKFLKCHFFNTFFYQKLISGRDGYNFQSVRRWTTSRKLGYSLLECDKIFVPIHQKIHWCLAVISKKDEKFQYLDSLKGVDSQVLNVLARYYVDEVRDKNGKELNVSSWEQEFVKDLPTQENGFDCGVFMVKYADFYSRDIGLCFSQKHLPYFRRRIANEILKLRAE